MLTDKSSKAGKDALLLPAGLSAEKQLFLPEAEERALFFDSLVTLVAEGDQLLTCARSPTRGLSDGLHAPITAPRPSEEAAKLSPCVAVAARAAKGAQPNAVSPPCRIPKRRPTRPAAACHR